MSDDALREVLRSPLDDPPSRRRRGERRVPEAPTPPAEAGDAALREVLRSPLDDPPPDRSGAWVALTALVAAAGCGLGATVGIRALAPGQTADTVATTTTPSATSTTLAGPAVLGGVEARALAAFRQGGRLYLVVATTVLPGDDATEVGGVPGAHWVLRVGDGDLVAATGEFVFPTAPGAFTLEFPDTDISGGVELLAYPATDVVEQVFHTSLDSAQFPWAGPPAGTLYRLGAEELVVDRVRLHDAGGEITWHLAGDTNARAVVDAGATYSELGVGPQAIVSERALPAATLVAGMGGEPSTRSGSIHLFHLDDVNAPTYRSRFWGDPERSVLVEQLDLAITVRLFTYAADPVVIAVDLEVAAEG